MLATLQRQASTEQSAVQLCALRCLPACLLFCMRAACQLAAACHSAYCAALWCRTQSTSARRLLARLTVLAELGLLLLLLLHPLRALLQAEWTKGASGRCVTA